MRARTRMVDSILTMTSWDNSPFVRKYENEYVNEYVNEHVNEHANGGILVNTGAKYISVFKLSNVCGTKNGTKSGTENTIR